MRETIQATIKALCANPKGTDDEIVELLVAGGAERTLAKKLVTLLPLAYGRVVFAKTRVVFSECFRTCDERGEVGGERRLDSLPLWTELLAAANSEISNGVAEKALFAIIGRSCEFQAINQLLLSGSQLQNIACTPPVLHWKICS